MVMAIRLSGFEKGLVTFMEDQGLSTAASYGIERALPYSEAVYLWGQCISERGRSDNTLNHVA